MAANPELLRQRGKKPFYAWAAVAIVLIVFAGFARRLLPQAALWHPWPYRTGSCPRLVMKPVAPALPGPEPGLAGFCRLACRPGAS